MTKTEQTDYYSARKMIALLHRTALLAALAIVVVAGLGIHSTFQRYVIHSAESDAIRVSQAFMAVEEGLLPGRLPDGRVQKTLGADSRARLDKLLRKLAHPFDIVKIKVFSLDGTILYSTDSSLTGRHDENNPTLQRALRGYSDSKLQSGKEVKDLASERRFDVDVVETYVPIRDAQHQVVGVFEVYQDVSRYQRRLTYGVAGAVTILVVMILVVLAGLYLMLRLLLQRLGDAHQRLYRLTTRDGLTGLVNRDEVLRRADEEMARYLRQQQGSEGRGAFSLVLIDIDHFSRLNELYGHQAGDEVLVETGRRIRAQLRIYNEVGRYGGEMFLVLLPGSDASNALQVAERIRLGVVETPFHHGDESFAITLSLGVATAHEDDDPQAVLRRASLALRAAKERGRNRAEMIGLDCPS